MRHPVHGELPFASARHRAQDVVEYGVIIAMIAMVVLLGVTAFGNQIKPWFEQLAGHITTVGT
jgi:Flp pilus assembly pilin Flp